jgi:hypothetical protein
MGLSLIVYGTEIDHQVLEDLFHFIFVELMFEQVLDQFRLPRLANRQAVD